MKRSQIAITVFMFLGLVILAAGPFFRAEGQEKAAQLKVLKTISLGGEGRWDYLGVDGAARRLYVPRNNHVQVVDLDKGALVGDILKVSTKVAHGVAVAPAQNLGFVTTGKDNVVVVFDLKTLKITTTIKTGSNPDGIIYDPASKHILAMNHSAGSITVIDPADLEKTATITVGGKLESAVADGAGMVFVCVEDKSEVVQIDSKANKVLARWSVEPGDGPTGLAIDTAHHRLFAGCGNQKMIVLDAKTGKILGTPAIGKGVDGAAFDPVLGVALSANGKDGTLSVVKETSAGKFETIQTLKTFAGARTIAIDPVKHQALLPCNLPDANGTKTFGIVVVGR